MTHAPRGGRRVFAATLYDGLSSIGALTVRDELVNNTLHAADEAMAKVLVDWMAPDSSKITGTPQMYLAGDMEAAATWYRMASYGPFGLSVFDDGTPYKIVTEIYAKASSAAATKIAVQIGPITDTPSEIDHATGNNSDTWATSSTTLAWLTPTSGSNLIVPTAAAFMPPRVRTTTDIPAGSAREILQCEFFVNVFGYSTGGVAEPQIHGMLVREYVGA